MGGFYLKAAAERGWQVSGVDPSEKSIAYARSMVGDNVVCGTLDNIRADRRYDAITLINVLDHTVDACLQLQKVKELLAPEGILYLRFPNGAFHSFIMRMSLIISDKQFMNCFLIFHEYAITPRFIRRCLGDMGFVDILVFNSRLAGGDIFTGSGTFVKLSKLILRSLTLGFFKALEKLSGGRWLWGPSLQISCRSKITVTLKCSDQHKEP